MRPINSLCRKENSLAVSVDVCRLMQTFLVVARDNTMFRFSTHDALFLLSPFNPVRRGAIIVLTHPYPFAV